MPLSSRLCIANHPSTLIFRLPIGRRVGAILTPFRNAGSHRAPAARCATVRLLLKLIKRRSERRTGSSRAVPGRDAGLLYAECSECAVAAPHVLILQGCRTSALVSQGPCAPPARRYNLLLVSHAHCTRLAHLAGSIHRRALFAGEMHAGRSSCRPVAICRPFRRGLARGALGTQGPCNSPLILQGRCRVCCARPPYAGPAARFAGECRAGSRFPTHPAGALHDSAQNAWACRVSAATTLRNEFSAARFPFAMQSPCVLSRRRIAGQTGGGAYAGVRPLSRGAGPAPLDARVRAPASRSRPPPASDKTPLRTRTRTPCGLMKAK